MRDHTSAHVNTDLPLKLMQAVQEPQKWADVLDFIMMSTGAKAAIITLRDKKTCQIVNDTELEQKFHSPLIRGFSTEAIVHYLTNLRTIDPWAAFQKTYYPHHPVQMSKICPQSSVKDSRFFDWLRSEGLQDTVVFELDRMSGYWTALNLFIEDPDAADADQVLEFCNANYHLLRNAWSASQVLTHSTQVREVLLTRAANAGSPTCVVGPNGDMIECNDLFLDVVNSDAIRLSGTTKKVSFAHSVSIQGLERWEQHEFLSHDSDAAPIYVSANAIDPDPLFPSKRENMWLLTCCMQYAEQAEAETAPPINIDMLTPQEKGLYRAIDSGLSIPNAGKSIGVQRSRSFEIWSSIKVKLDIKNAHQIRN